MFFFFFLGGNRIQYILEEEKYTNIMLHLHEYLRTSHIDLKANRQSCQLDGSHSRRGGTSSNETGGM